MARPSKKSSEKFVSITITMPPDELDIFDVARGKLSRSAYARLKFFGSKKSKSRR